LRVREDLGRKSLVNADEPTATQGSKASGTGPKNLDQGAA